MLLLQPENCRSELRRGRLSRFPLQLSPTVWPLVGMWHLQASEGLPQSTVLCWGRGHTLLQPGHCPSGISLVVIRLEEIVHTLTCALGTATVLQKRRKPFVCSVSMRWLSTRDHLQGGFQFHCCIFFFFFFINVCLQFSVILFVLGNICIQFWSFSIPLHLLPILFTSPNLPFCFLLSLLYFTFLLTYIVGFSYKRNEVIFSFLCLVYLS